MHVRTYAYAYSWNLEKYLDFYFLKELLSFNRDKYFALYGVFVLRFPLSFYLSGGVEWIRMWSHRPWLRLLTKRPPSLSQSISNSQNFVDLSRLNMHSGAWLQRYEYANSFKKDHDRREIEFSCNSAYEHKDVIYLCWWRYNWVCLSKGYTSRPLLVTSLMVSLFHPFLLQALYLTDSTRDG